ncbi:MAG: hypothetical protein ABFS39_14775 [Pseudomonadota bacterium]
MEIIKLKPDEKKLKTKLVETEKRLEKKPNSWFRLEQVARILSTLGDPRASEFFRQAIEKYPFSPLRGSGKDRPSDFMRVGNLYRHLGEHEMAYQHFQRARQRYSEKISEKAQRKYADPSLEIEHMIEPSFLVGQDNEVRELIEQLCLLDPDTDIRAYAIAKLAAARQNKDMEQAAESVNQFAQRIRRERAQIWVSGGISLWDWYEIALAVWQEQSDIELCD